MNAPMRIDLTEGVQPLSRRIWQRIRAWFYRAQPSQAAPAPEPCRIGVRVGDEELGPVKPGLAHAIDIHDILDQLPAYFSALKGLRRFDEDTYSVLSQLGAPIVTKDSLFSRRQISSDVLRSPPFFRCVTLGHFNREDGKRQTPSFLYMQYLGSGQVCVGRDGGFVNLPSGGPCYRVVSSFNNQRMGDFAVSCYVQIGDDCIARVIPERNIIQQEVGKGRQRRRFAKSVVSTPSWLKEAAADIGLKDGHEYIHSVCSIILSAERPKDCIMVRASQGSTVASWTIDRRDAKRFFRQRETGTASDGKRKRVLHYVAPFTRQTARGQQHVREHYRGERSFSWNDYGIEISGLGFHHGDFFEASIPAYEDQRNEKMVSLANASKRIRQHYSRPHSLTTPRKVAQ